MNSKSDSLPVLNKALRFAKRGDWDRANELIDGCGIEYVECAGRELRYINLGDTYDATICQEDEDAPFIGSWGDWYESTEQEHCEDEDVIRCGWCSEFTPVAEDWRATICESCGNYVDGGVGPNNNAHGYPAQTN